MDRWLYSLDNEGQTPLTRICRTGRTEIASLMVAHEADDVTTEAAKLPPLHRAVCLGQDGNLRDMLTRGLDPCERDSRGETPLHRAVRIGGMETVDVLLENGADVNARDIVGMTPLHWAALTGRTEAAEVLMTRGADPWARDTFAGGLTPLELARMMSYDEVGDLIQMRSTLF
jgi:ankyrin repeat protein